jgi:hypothetical protein
MTLSFEIMMAGANILCSIYGMLDTAFCTYLPKSELLLREHNLMSVTDDSPDQGFVTMVNYVPHGLLKCLLTSFR